ncbi:MAG: hypothetical protein HY749_01490 [Gammaproteobacteria bacterium]|nr:hypothetical protein [Gammaproteobacteria bacterium]
MSLINQMLTDLEERRSRAPKHQDAALEGLVAVAPRTLARERRVAWPLVIAGVVLLAIAAVWAARSGLSLLTKSERRSLAVQTRGGVTMTFAAAGAAPVAAPQPALSAPAPVAAVLPAAPPPAAIEATASAATLPAALQPQAQVAATPAPPAPAVEPAPRPATLADPTVPPKPVKPAPPPAGHPVDVAEAPVVERRGDFHRNPAAPRETKLPSALDRAYSLLDLGRTDEGLDALTAHLRDAPKDVPARVRLAAELIRLERIADAETRLREGLALLPGEARFAGPLAHLAFERGDAAGALVTLQGAVPPLASDVEYHAFMAALQQQTGAHTAAVMIYRDVLKARPDNGAWWIGLGISLEATGDHADAARAFGTALGDHGLSEPMRTYATREMVRLKDRNY